MLGQLDSCAGKLTYRVGVQVDYTSSAETAGGDGHAKVILFVRTVNDDYLFKFMHACMMYESY